MKDLDKAMPNISCWARKAIRAVPVAIFLLFAVSCGKDDSNFMYCTPNYVQGSIGMRITYLVGSLNEFQFQVCYNDTFGAGEDVTVYGVEFASDIATISPADARLAHLEGGLRAGDTFSVTFNSSDSWFIIYEDDGLGGFATTNELIRGQFR